MGGAGRLAHSYTMALAIFTMIWGPQKAHHAGDGLVVERVVYDIHRWVA